MSDIQICAFLWYFVAFSSFDRGTVIIHRQYLHLKVPHTLLSLYAPGAGSGSKCRT